MIHSQRIKELEAENHRLRCALFGAPVREVIRSDDRGRPISRPLIKPTDYEPAAMIGTHKSGSVTP